MPPNLPRPGLILASAVVLFGVSAYFLSELPEPSLGMLKVLFIVLLAGALLLMAAGAVSIWRSEERDLSQYLIVGLALLVVIPGIVILLMHERLQISHHGYFHSAYVYEVLHGVIPPDNPALANTPANDYWLFHVFIAVIGSVFQAAPPLVSHIVNSAAMVASLFSITRILTTLDLRPRSPFLAAALCLFVLFACNSIGILRIIATGQFPSIDFGILNTVVVADNPRLVGLLPKFLAFNGFPMGVAFFLFAIDGALRVVKEGPGSEFVARVAVGTIGALAYHVTTGVLLVGVLPVALVIAMIVRRERYPRRNNKRSLLIILAVTAVGLAAMASYLYTTSQALPASTQLTLFDERNVRAVWGALWPILPIPIVVALVALKQRREMAVFLAGVAGAGLGMSLFLDLPGGNQYKFVFLAAFPLALMSLQGLKWAMGWGLPWKALSVTAGALAVVAVLGTLVGTELATERSKWARSSEFSYDGTHVDSRRKNDDIYMWARDNLSQKAVLVTPLVFYQDADLMMLSERRSFAIPASIYTRDGSIYDERREQVRKFFNSPNPSLRQGALSRIIEQGEGLDLVLIVPRDFDSGAGLNPAAEIFNGVGGTIYKLPEAIQG